MTEQLIRIGPGVPKPPRRRLNPTWPIAAAVLIAVGLMVFAVYFLDPPSQTAAPQASGPPVKTQVECETIRHEHEIWEQGRDDLDLLPNRAAYVAEYDVSGLIKSGKAFFEAASGRDDAAAKTLAVAIAQYNLDISVINLELSAGSQISAASHQKAAGSWIAVDAAYDKFLRATCGS